MEHGVFRACTAILLREIEILGRIPPLQMLLRDALINREWADYEKLLESIQKTGADFEILETRRDQLFRNLTDNETADEKERFYAAAARLPCAEREKLTALYRRLKMEALQIRLANDTLVEYIKATKTAITGILESVYPDRKGKIYSRKGMEREADMKSVILNRSF